MRKVTWDNATGLCNMKKVQRRMVLSVTAFLEGIHGVNHVQTLLKLCRGDWGGPKQSQDELTSKAV